MDVSEPSAIEALKEMESDKMTPVAAAHRDAIAGFDRFGRFPHRHAAMGRDNTQEGDEYLRIPPTWGKGNYKIRFFISPFVLHHPV